MHLRDYFKKDTNWFYVPLALAAVTVMILNRSGPWEGQLRTIAFVLFTILCISFLVLFRNSKWRIFGVLIYYIFFGLVSFL
jgi:hypothetical protein